MYIPITTAVIAILHTNLTLWLVLGYGRNIIVNIAKIALSASTEIKEYFDFTVATITKPIRHR